MGAQISERVGRSLTDFQRRIASKTPLAALKVGAT